MIRATLLFLRYHVLVPAIIALSIGSFLIAFLFIPRVSWVWNMLGFDSKASVFAQAVYWSVKVKLADGVEVPVQPEKVVFGDIVGFTQDARIVLLVPDGKRYVRTNFAVANVQLVDQGRAAAVSRNYAGQSVRADIYGDAAVIWQGETMINLAMIVDGTAAPDPNPPSPAYHALFARHLWKRLGM